MPTEVYSRLEIAVIVSLESPIEERMAGILEDGPGTGCRAVFMHATSVDDAKHMLAGEPTLSRRYPLIVVPQPTVGRYRPDYLVVTTAPGTDPASLAWKDRAFLVECDGDEFHGSAEQVSADRRREKEIRSATGLDVVRFSGGEINYGTGSVISLLEASVELRMAVQAHPEIWEAADMDSVRRRLSRMTSLPAQRQQHVGRNSRPMDPYDSLDPFGEALFGAYRTGADEFDDMDSILSDRVSVRHHVAAARREWSASTAADFDEEPGGGFRHIGDVMYGLVEDIADRMCAGTV
jgi:hypothetical protein